MWMSRRQIRIIELVINELDWLQWKGTNISDDLVANSKMSQIAVKPFQAQTTSIC